MLIQRPILRSMACPTNGTTLIPPKQMKSPSAGCRPTGAPRPFHDNSTSAGLGREREGVEAQPGLAEAVHIYHGMTSNGTKVRTSDCSIATALSLTPRFSGVDALCRNSRTASAVFRPRQRCDSLKPLKRLILESGSGDTPLKRGVNERRECRGRADANDLLMLFY